MIREGPEGARAFRQVVSQGWWKIAELADKFEKSRPIRLVKLAEIAIMALAVAGFLWGGPYLMLAMLFLMETQSAFFGPLKYGILPDHLAEDELIGGNAFIEPVLFSRS